MRKIFSRFDYFRRTIDEGALMPPWYYGFAYEMYDRNKVAFVIMPFNYIVQLYIWLNWKYHRFRGTRPWYHKHLFKWAQNSYTHGFREGFEIGKKLYNKEANVKKTSD